MNRRGFLQGILIAAAAPAIVRADSLMRMVPTETVVLAGESAEFSLWYGAIREIWAYDISSDSMIHRFDVAGYDKAGCLVQRGVDIRVDSQGPRPSDRDAAIAILRSNIHRDGIRPIPGHLKIPSGLQGRYL